MLWADNTFDCSLDRPCWELGQTPCRAAATARLRVANASSLTSKKAAAPLRTDFTLEVLQTPCVNSGRGRERLQPEF